ncbi:perilipin-3-like isoform X15 [Chelonia mydas]|uniref:perilipin-3-like isoform X16 n=1 Tax=Chelonia mydas TaxID=8469 RepID=UPI0018A1EABF|nr:perilipin-3-like isoform X16 [Chelonia mydas]XP_043403399.1 perilipin-3-like isoform X15 [Chelonia mydas]
MSAQENEPQVEIQAEEQQTAVDRVGGLPLVSSACEMASASYAATKETHPAIKAVCEVAETGVRAITSAAITGAQPILAQLEPQLAAANEYACRGLDRLEEQLPILQQPIEKVALDAQDIMRATMVGAKDAVCSTVTEAKDAVTIMVSMAQGAVQESVEVTKSAVTSSMSTVMGSSMGQMAVSGIDTALGKSEQLVDYYLPMTEEELAELATTPLEGPGEAPAEQRSYYVRLGSLSSTLRQRAYQHALGKMRQARQRTLEALSQLQQIIDLIKQAVDQKLHNGQDRLYQMWLQCCRGKLEGQEEPDSAKVEAQALATSQSLTQQLKTTCLTLLGSIQGLPSTIQDKAQQVSSSIEELQASFSSASCFQDLSSSALARSREMVTKAQESLDELLEYVTQNIALDWIVGPFTPAGDSPPCPDELVEEGKKVEA